MKRLGMNKMTVVYSQEPFPKDEMKSIFLAGPVPRKEYELSWKNEALEILDSMGYNGVVYIPENRNPEQKEGNFDLQAQLDWEYTCMCACDAIVFWIPREMRSDFEMIGLTTNVEFGRFLNSNKLFCGCPDEAPRMEYLKLISRDKYEWHNTLEDTLKSVVQYLGRGMYREDEEIKIPLHIYKSKQFQNWYKQQLNVGNYLTGFNMEYEFVMPKAKQMFLEIFHPSVYIAKEDRVKDNEFVVARTDMSYILAYYKKEDIMDSEIVLCEEFRSPINNNEEMVFELPGGSSLNPNDDVLSTASKELEEETGLKLDKNRFEQVALKQSAATLCSHKIALFRVELTEEEINSLKKDNSIHGVIEDTERIHLHVMKVSEALDMVDWTNTGMILNGIKE
jgi:8-oxo-dGTP pyrophosphatase MutT (NUDIX family)